MLERGELQHFQAPMRPLLQFSSTVNSKDKLQLPTGRLPVRAPDYLQLVDATGRLHVHGKRGRIDASATPILDRLGLSRSEWIQASSSLRLHYRNGDLHLKRTA
jgi:hypothetical protein